MSFNKMNRSRGNKPTITKTVLGSEFNSLIARHTLQGYMLVNVVVADTGAVLEISGGKSIGFSADVKPDVIYTVTLKLISDPSFFGSLF